MEIVIGKTRKCTVLIDEEDFTLISKYRWARKVTKMDKMYACSLGPKRIPMHRLIMNCTEDRSAIVDHINHNGLDNRKSNLRIVSKAQNCKNRRSARNSTSKYLGVSKRGNYFTAQIGIGNRKTISLGRFKNEIDAAKAYNERAKIVHGEFANLNKL